MSDPLIDPLRTHTYGVKRTLEEKKGEIEELYKNNKRYYPKDKLGGLDEWGAVIKNQNETFNRIAEIQRMEKTKNMESYGKELVDESDKRVREQKYQDQSQKDYELNLALNKKKESDMINTQTMATKKNIQNVLAHDYENAIRMRKLQQDSEKRESLMAGQASVNRAQVEIDYLRRTEDEKKRMIREILNNDKMAHDDKKKMQNKTEVMGVAEAKKLIGESEQKQMVRDYQFGQRYNYF